jgi:DNA-directed RNA polymerase specialized sigma54-like protein
MKFTIGILTTVLTTISITGQAMAQARTPAQEFFEQGWDQLEREIRILQNDKPEAEESLQHESGGKPLLDVNPTADSETHPEIEGIETPNSQPEPIDDAPVN